jgi:hypothetical protein
MASFGYRVVVVVVVVIIVIIIIIISNYFIIILENIHIINTPDGQTSQDVLS